MDIDASNQVVAGLCVDQLWKDDCQKKESHVASRTATTVERMGCDSNKANML